MDRNAALTTIDASLGRVRRAQSSRRTASSQSDRSGVMLPPLSLSILAELDRRGPSRVQTLADRVEVELARVSREVHALARSGHVRIEVDSSDRRARVVTLTPFGTAQWTTHRGAARDMLAELLDGWDDDAVVDFAELLDRFVHLHRPAVAATA